MTVSGAYCAVTDVESFMQQNFQHDAGYPTFEDVEGMIVNVAADLNGVAQAAGYDVPVTATAAVALMKRYNILGAAVEAWHSAFISEAEPARVEYWRTQYAQFVARLRRGEQELPTEEPLSDLDPSFDIAPAVRRDTYWTTDQELD